MLGKLINTGVSPSMKVKIFNGLKSKLDEPQSLSAVESESKELAVITLVIEEALSRTQKSLDNSNVDHLKAEFGALRKEYAELAWQSREELGRVEAVFNDFTGAFASIFEEVNTTQDVADMAVEIAEFVKRIVATQGNLHSDGWNKFLTNLKAFDQKFTSNDLGNTTVGPEIDELTKKVASLTAEVKSSDDLIHQAASNSAGAGESIQALIALSNIAPIETGHVLNAGSVAADGQEDAQLSKALARKTGITQEIAGLENQVENRTEGLDNDLAKIKANLDRSCRLVESIKDRMHNLLGPVLGMLVADLQNVAKSSAGAALTRDGTFQARAGLVASAYKGVRVGLNAYSDATR